MIDPIPPWVINRYKLLWKEFGTDKFSFASAKKILREDTKFVSVFLSELKKLAWVTVELDTKDSRKRLYQLKSLQDVAKEIMRSTFGDVSENIEVKVQQHV